MKKALIFIIAALALLPMQVHGNDLIQTSYTIEYYYDSVLDNKETFSKTGNVGDLIIEFPDKKREGYELFYSTIDDEGLTLCDNPSFNEIEVFYTKIGTNNGTILPPQTGIEEKGANIILPGVLILGLLLARKKLKN